MKSLRRSAIAIGATAFLMLGACSSNEVKTASSSGGDDAASSAPGQGSEKVGFIFVGPKDDYGYNQAAYEGSQAVAKEFPDIEVLTAENVPEDDSAVRIMQGMIDKGAKIIFAKSYGHLDPAIKIA